MKKDIKKEIISDLLVVVVAIVIFFIVTKFFCIFFTVKGSSMSNTILENEKGISFYYDLDNIQRFDIVSVDSNKDKTLIKRIIGLPNEKIEYKNNKLFINDVYVDEPFLDDNTNTDDLLIVLNDNEYFCLGDNREVSNDSRIYGPFNKESIKSTHVFIIYPFNRIRFIK